MALTTNAHVWKIMAVITLLVLGLFAVLFYFKDIFLTFVIGVIMITFTKKIKAEYLLRMKSHEFTHLQRRLYSIWLIVFWLCVVYLLCAATITDLTDIVGVVHARSAGGMSVTDQYITRVHEMLPVKFADQVISPDLVNKAQELIVSLLSSALSEVSFIILNGVLIIPMMFYLYFKKRKKIVDAIHSLIPTKFNRAYAKATKDISRELHDFLTAKMIESIVIAALCCAGFYVIGLKGWLFMGVMAGFLNIVPYIGPAISIAPPFFVGLLFSPWIALGAVVIIIIAQIIDNLYLIPFMISSKVKMDSLLAIVIILIGAQLGGPIGMVFAIPVYSVFKIILRQSYRELVKIYPMR